jgi:hypothetical protein
MGLQHSKFWTVAGLVSWLVLAESAQAANKYSWGFIKSGRSEARLFYGIPESDIVTLIFACDTASKRIEIITTVLPRKPRKGQPARTTLGNGAVTAAYDGKVGTNASGDEFHFEASAAAAPKAVDILKSGSSLVIGIPGQQERVPLKGVAKPLAQFETACFRGRPRWWRHSAARLTVEMPVRAALHQRR